MDNGYFVVKFSLDDYNFVMYGGPWLIFKHYLTIRPWRPNFDIDQEDIKSLLVGVRLLYFPIEYCNHVFLMKISRTIGMPIKIHDAYESSFQGPLCTLIKRKTC